VAVERRPAAHRVFQQDQFGVGVVDHRGRRHHLAAGGADGDRVVVVLGLDRFLLLRIALRRHFGLAVAEAEIGARLLGLDVAAGAADADGGGRRHQLQVARRGLVAAPAEDAEHLAGDDAHDLDAGVVLEGDLGLFALQEGVGTDDVDGLAAFPGHHGLPHLDVQPDRGAGVVDADGALEAAEARRGRQVACGQRVAHQAEDAAGAQRARGGQLEQQFAAGQTFDFLFVHSVLL